MSDLARQQQLASRDSPPVGDPIAASRDPATNKSHPTVPHSQRSVWKRIWFRSVVVFLAIVAAFYFLPSMSNWAPVRTWILSRITGRVHGKLDADNLRIGWQSPLHVDGARLVAPDGTPVLTIPRLEGDRTLWQLVSSPSTLGRYRVDQPTLHLHLRPDGSNLADAFALRAPPEALTSRMARAMIQNAALNVEIADGQLEFLSRPNRQPWALGDLNLHVRWHPPQRRDPRAYIAVDSGQLLSHVEITPDIARDLLQFVAPILARTTTCDGTFSLSTDGAVFPLASLSDAYCVSDLHIHTIHAGPGPLIAELAALLQVPDTVELVSDSLVHFTFRDRKVTHEGLHFQLGRIDGWTSGTVNLDESIQLKVTLKLPEAPPQDGPIIPERVARFLRGRTITIPFHGTLRRPRIDWEAWLREAASDRTLIQNLISENPELMKQAWKIMQHARDVRKRLRDGEQPPDDETTERVDDPRPLRRLRDFLRQRLKPEEDDPPRDSSSSNRAPE